MGKVKQSIKPAYAGIGCVNTPDDVQDMLAEIAEDLEQLNFVLRTGGSLGADEAFMDGVIEDSNIELFLPYQGYNDYESKYHKPNAGSYEAAFLNHPSWSECSTEQRKLHGRTSFIVLGHDLRTPSEFILCWTKGGKGNNYVNQAIRVADNNLIPVFDFGAGMDATYGMFEEYLDKQGYLK